MVELEVNLPGRREAMDRLTTLIADAARDLAHLGSTCIVAASPNAHDDTGRYPEWYGVQVGRATWERSDYRLDCGGDVEETAKNPDDLPAARVVLERLQAASWRRLASLALGLSFYDEVLAAVIQYGAAWFIVAGSNWGHCEAFVLSDRRLLRVGKPARLDDRLGRIFPLVLETINPATWSALQTTALEFPISRPASSLSAERNAAKSRFIELLSAAFTRMSLIPGNTRYAASSRVDPDFPMFGWQRWRSIAVDDRSAARTAYSVEKRNWYQRALEEDPTLSEVDAVVSELDAANWSELFDKGVMSLSQTESLALMVRDSECYLIFAQIAVFELNDRGDLALVGACDHPGAQQIIVHRFDGNAFSISN